MLADELDYMIGVDTHRDEHVLAVVTAPTGAVIARTAVAANRSGYREALRFAARYAPAPRAWAIEGAGHYGAGLARLLSEHGEAVLELSRTPRSRASAPRQGRRARRSRNGTGGAGQRHTRAAAQRGTPRGAATAADRPAQRRRRAPRGARATTSRHRDRSRPSTRRAAPAIDGRLLERCGHLRRSARSRPDELATRLVLRSLARRIEAATSEADELEREILAHVRALAPELLDEPGVGPIVAAQLIVAWSHRGRLRSEACFARLAGVAPVPASSGQTTRHRLSRGGDRQLNRALHTIVLHRRQHDPATSDYVARRVAEGKTRREATRLLKRYLARHLYRVLQNQRPLMT